MNKIEEALTEYWGERCPDHEPECPTCQAWGEYDKLMERAMKKFFLHIPGWVHAMTAYGLNKTDAVRRFKHQHGMVRMPRGYGIWEAQ